VQPARFAPAPALRSQQAIDDLIPAALAFFVFTISNISRSHERRPGTPTADVKSQKEKQPMNNDNQDFASIDNNSLSNVTGGGLFGAAVRLGKKAVPFIKRAAPVVGHRLVDSAKWGGIPTVGGAGVAWLQHEITHR
jgi:hypothetical protein